MFHISLLLKEGRTIKLHNYVKIMRLDFRTICRFLTVLATQKRTFEPTINTLQMGYVRQTDTWSSVWDLLKTIKIEKCFLNEGKGHTILFTVQSGQTMA